MIQLRPAEARGKADFGWLDSRHSFSFGHYHDPAHMGFGPLRVINEDRVAPGGGFDTHGHRDMEIISYVLDGALQHRDLLGTGSVIRPGDVQRMTAGSGIEHSEFNASQSDPVHFLQIWILPDKAGLEPSYEQAHFPAAERRNVLRLVASGHPRDGAVKLHRDVDVHASLLDEGAGLVHRPRSGRKVWIQLARGEIEVNGERLRAGDGLALEAVEEIAVTSLDASEFLLFDMA